MDLNKLKTIYDAYGDRTQTIKAIEECSELIQDLCKFAIGEEQSYSRDAVLAEIADVEIMIAQLKHFMLHTHPYEMDELYKFKLDRQIERIAKRDKARGIEFYPSHLKKGPLGTMHQPED
jgi:hypothetical protein